MKYAKFADGLGLSLSELDQKAIVQRMVRPEGVWRVRFRGSSWRAISAQPGIEFLPNDVVEVVGRQNITLLIQPRAHSQSIKSLSRKSC